MRSTNRDGLITFEVDEVSLQKIEKALGNLKDEAPRVLKNAVNRTARDAKKELAAKAQETYVVKTTRFAKAMRMKNATQQFPVATISVTGSPLELKDFKTSPAKYQPANRPPVTKAKVLKSGGMKNLEIPSRNAFIVKFKSGHVSVAQRRSADRFPLKKLMSNSIPTMVGSQEHVYGILEPKIHDMLLANVQKEIEKVKSV